MKTRTAINTLENRKAIKKLMKPKVGSLGKKKSTKLIGLQLTDQETKKREDSNYQTRNESRDITTDLTETKIILREKY